MLWTLRNVREAGAMRRRSVKLFATPKTRSEAVTEDEFRLWLFPPVLSWQRKLAIRCLMIGLVILSAYLGHVPQ